VYIRTLVEQKKNDGRLLLMEIDRSTLVGTRAAFWFYDTELAEWRLVIHFPQLDRMNPTAAYTLLHLIMSKMPSLSIRLDEIAVQSSKSALLQAMALIVRTGPRATEIRPVRARAAGAIWVEEAYVYRCAL
jgi:hypothetical protein